MRKLLGSTLALAMFLPASANAELFKNLKANGQLDVQTVSANNIEDFVTRPNHASGGSGPGALAAAGNNDRLGKATSRLIVTVTNDLLDDVHGKVTFVKGAHNQAASNRIWGGGAENTNTIQTGTFVQEANVKIDKLFGNTDTTLGRQFYGDAGDLIIYFGPRDNYGLRVDALDVARFDWKGDHMNATAIVGKTTDLTGVAGTGGAATDLRGIALSCTKSENVMPSLYLYNAVGRKTGAIGQPNNGNDNLYVAGLKAKIKAGMLWANAEFAKNFGENRTGVANTMGSSARYSGWAFLGKAGAKVDVSNVAMLGAWGELGVGTGRSRTNENRNETFTAINSDYRPGAIYGKFDTGSAVPLGGAVSAAIQSNGLSNRVIWGAGVKATPTRMNKLTAGLQFYRYAFQRIATVTNGTVTTSRNIGSEVDLTADWKHSENVSLKTALGSFQPGQFVRDTRGANAAVNPALMASADVVVRW